MTMTPATQDQGAHIRITRGNPLSMRPIPANPPFHCALIAGNHEITWWTEDYVDRDGARDAIAWLGRLFSPVDRATVYLPIERHTDGYLEVWLDDQELGEKLHVPVRYVDERTGS